MNMLKSAVFGLLLAVGLSSAAFAQPSGVLVGPIGGSTGSSAVNLTCGTGLLCSPSPITGTGSVTPSVFQNDQVGTSYALLTTDGGKIVAGSNASAQAYSLSAASTTGFGSGYGFDLYNRGAGALTLTATTSTFGNALTTLVLATGQEAYIAADAASTNYLSFVSLPVMATNTVLGNVAAANYPVALTTTQLTTLVNAFSSSLSGAAPASGGGTTNFLRADGSWTVPGVSAGVSSITGTANQITASASTGAVTLSIPAVAAIGTSLAVGGCTIGANAICATGAIQVTGAIAAGATSTIAFNGRGLWSSPGAGFIEQGVDSGTPVAQTTYVAGGSGTNIAGQNWTIGGSRATGSASSGDINFQTGGAVAGSGGTVATWATALTLKGVTGAVLMPLLAASSAGTTGTVCWTTGGGNLTVDTTTTCLLSSRRFKQNILPLQNGLSEVMNLTPVSYELKPQYNPTKLGRLPGLIAEDVMKVDPRLVGLDPKGKPHGVRYELLTAVLVKAVQQQQTEIAELQKKLAARH